MKPPPRPRVPRRPTGGPTSPRPSAPTGTHTESTPGSTGGARTAPSRTGGSRTGGDTVHPQHPGGTTARAGRDLDRPRTPRTLSGPLEAADAAAVLGSHEEAVSVGLGERLRERRRARRRLRGTRLLVLVSSLATVAVIAWGILFSPLLALADDQIAVSGGGEDLDTQVLAATAPFVGTPLPRLDTAAVVSAVESIPMVRDATVTRSWPRGLRVEVSGRVAVLAEKDSEGVALVDDQGVVVSHQAEVPEGLPLVSLPAEGPGRQRGAEGASTAWAALSTDLRTSVDQMSTDGNTLTLTLEGGRTVHWGTAEDAKLKAKVLAVLLDQRPATVYDISVPTRPVTS